MDILLGQFDKYFQVFIILMIIDYLSGIIATIYKKEINNYKQIVTNDQKIDSLRVETIKVVKEDLKQTKKSLKKSKILNGVFGISTLALIIINIL